MTPLTQEEIEKIEKRANAATEGPWNWRGDKGDFSWGCTALESEKKLVINLIDEYPGYPECGEDLRANMEPADGEFIEHSRTDVPALIHTARVQHEALVEMVKMLRVTEERGLHPEQRAGATAMLAAIYKSVGPELTAELMRKAGR